MECRGGWGGGGLDGRGGGGREGLGGRSGAAWRGKARNVAMVGTGPERHGWSRWRGTGRRGGGCRPPGNPHSVARDLSPGRVWALARRAPTG